MRAKPAFTADLIESFRAKARALKAAGGPEVKIGTLKKLYERGYRGDAPEARAMAKVDAHLADLAKSGHEEQPRKANGEFASTAGTPIDESPADKAKRAAHYAAWAGGYADKPAPSVKAPKSPFKTPKTAVLHRALQDQDAGYAALTSGVIPEKRYALIGETARVVGAGAAGVGLAIGLQRGRANGVTARLMRDVPASLGTVAGKLGVRLPARIVANMVTRAHATVAGVDPGTITAYKAAARKLGAIAERTGSAAGHAVGNAAFRMGHMAASGITSGMVGDATNRGTVKARQLGATLLVATPLAYGINRTVEGSPVDPEQVGDTADTYSYRVVRKAAGVGDLHKALMSDDLRKLAATIGSDLRKSVGDQDLGALLPRGDLAKSSLYSAGGRALVDLGGSALGAVAGALTGAGQAVVRNHLPGKKGNPYHDSKGRFTSEGSADTDTKARSIRRGALAGAAIGATAGLGASHVLTGIVNRRLITAAIKHLDAHTATALRGLSVSASKEDAIRDRAEGMARERRSLRDAHARVADARARLNAATDEGAKDTAMKDITRGEAQVEGAESRVGIVMRELRGLAHPAMIGPIANRQANIDAATEADTSYKAARDADKLYGASSPFHYKQSIKDALNTHIAGLMAGNPDFMIPGRNGVMTRIADLVPRGARPADMAARIANALDDMTDKQFGQAISKLSEPKQKTALHFWAMRQPAIDKVDKTLAGHEISIKNKAAELDAANADLKLATAGEESAVEQMKRAGTDPEREAAKSAHAAAKKTLDKAQKTVDKHQESLDKLKNNGAPVRHPITDAVIPPRTRMEREAGLELEKAKATERATKIVDGKIARTKASAEQRIRAAHDRRLATIMLMSRPGKVWTTRQRIRMIVTNRQANIDAATEADTSYKAARDADKLYGASSPFHYKQSIKDALNTHIAGLMAGNPDFMIPGRNGVMTRIADLVPRGARPADMAARIANALDDMTDEQFGQAISKLSEPKQKTALHFWAMRQPAIDKVDKTLAGHEISIKNKAAELDAANADLKLATAGEESAVEQMKRAGTDPEREAAKSAHAAAKKTLDKAQKTVDKHQESLDKLKNNGAPVRHPITDAVIPPRTRMEREAGLELEKAKATERATKIVDGKIARTKASAEQRIRAVAKLRAARSAAVNTSAAKAAMSDAAALKRVIAPGFQRVSALKARLKSKIGSPAPAELASKTAPEEAAAPRTADLFRDFVAKHDEAQATLDEVQTHHRTMADARSRIAELSDLQEKMTGNPAKRKQIGEEIAAKKAEMSAAQGKLQAAETEHAIKRGAYRDAGRKYRDAVHAASLLPKRRLLSGGLATRILGDTKRAGDAAYAPIHRFLVAPTANNFRRASAATPDFVRKNGRKVGDALRSVGREAFMRPVVVDGKVTGHTLDYRKIGGGVAVAGTVASGAAEYGRYAQSKVKRDKSAKFPRYFKSEMSTHPTDNSGHFGISIPHPDRKDDRLLLWGEYYGRDGSDRPLRSFSSMNDVRAAVRDQANRNNGSGQGGNDVSFLNDQEGKVVATALNSLHQNNGFTTILADGADVQVRKGSDTGANEAGKTFRRAFLQKYVQGKPAPKGGALYDALGGLFSKKGRILKAGSISDLLTGALDQDQRFKAGLFPKNEDLNSSDKGTAADGLVEQIDEVMKASPPQNDHQRALLKKAAAVIGVAKRLEPDSLSGVFDKINGGTSSSARQNEEPVFKGNPGNRAFGDAHWDANEVNVLAEREAGTLGRAMKWETVEDQEGLANALEQLAREAHKAGGYDVQTSMMLARQGILHMAGGDEANRQIAHEMITEGIYDDFRTGLAHAANKHNRRMSANKGTFVLDADALDDFDGLAKLAGMPTTKNPKSGNPGAAPQTSLSQILNTDSMMHAGDGGAPPAPQKISMPKSPNLGTGKVGGNPLGHDERAALRLATGATAASVTQFTPFGLRTAARREISDGIQHATGIAAARSGAPTYKTGAELGSIAAETAGAGLVGHAIRSKFGVGAPDTKSVLGALASPKQAVTSLFADGLGAGLKTAGKSLLAGGLASGAGALLYNGVNSALGGDQYNRKTTPGEMGTMALGNFGGATLGEIAGGAIGTAIAPGVGTFLGEVGGGAVGSALGEALGHFGFKAFAGYPSATVNRVLKTPLQSNTQVRATTAADAIAGAVGQALGGPKLEGITSLIGQVGASAATQPRAPLPRRPRAGAAVS